ncbi:MAG: anion permease [Clostridia bacterium]|nr:anion permease [Clostridia bacterium]
MYLLLAGIFMGWALGTNDAANAFGTAVATGVVKYRTVITVISTMVIVGAILHGQGNLDKLSVLAQRNEVIATTNDISNAVRNNSADLLKYKSAIKASVICSCAGLTVFLMSYFKLPVSANQSVIGAIIGWGFFHTDNFSSNLPYIADFFITWLINPLCAGIISYILVIIVRKFNITSKKLIKAGYLLAGTLASYSIGVNSSASITALYFDPYFKQTGVATNLLTDARLTAIIGGISIALGVLTFSKRVMTTVGSNIAHLTQTDGFIVIIAMAVTVLIMENVMGIPVSTSQTIVGAVVGAGLVYGVKNINFSIVKSIAFGWVLSPALAGVLSYFVAVSTQTYF